MTNPVLYTSELIMIELQHKSPTWTNVRHVRTYNTHDSKVIWRELLQFTFDTQSEAFAFRLCYDKFITEPLGFTVDSLMDDPVKSLPEAE